MDFVSMVLERAGQRECRKKTVVVVIGGRQVTFEARQPTLAERDEIFKAKPRIVVGPDNKPVVTDAGMKPRGEQAVDAVLACTVDPETGGAAFPKEKHKELRATLLNTPAEGWVQQLADAVFELLEPEPDLGKGSTETASSSSSTSSPSSAESHPAS